MRVTADEQTLREQIADAIEEASVDGLHEMEQARLREAVLAAVAPRLWDSERRELEAVLCGVDLPPSGPDDISVDGERRLASASYLAEVRRALIADEVVDAPVGDVVWSGEATYVACVYGPEGDQPGDCSARWGQDVIGLWWVDDGDDTVRCGRWGPFLLEEEAEERARALAEANHEGLPGEDAEAMIERLDEEATERATADGEWVVAWRDGDGPLRPGRAYGLRDDAEREIGAWYRALYAHTPSALVHLLDRPVLARRDGDDLVEVEEAE